MKDIPRINDGKNPILEENGEWYLCIALRTCLVTQHSDLDTIVEEYAKPFLLEGDILFLSEKMVACTEGRAIPMENIRSGFWAKLLCRFVQKSPYGIGLALPETMQCAIWECGLPRILLAACLGAADKLLHRNGWFYRVAGRQAAAIDGPCEFTIPPYNHCVVLAPKNAQQTADSLAEGLPGITVLVVDINDLGGEVLGASDGSGNRFASLLRQNPLGQSDEQTPMGILRRLT